MPKPVLTDYVTILTKENMEPLFELAWGAFKISGEDAVANTPAEGRAALDVYSKAEIDALLANLGDIGTLPTSKTIIPSTSLLSFSAFTDVAPADQTVTITNGGSLPLNFTVSDDAFWLNVTPTSGSDGTVLTISCSAQANAGTNNATITITDAAASNSPQTIAVNYVVSVAVENPIVAENQKSANAMSLTTGNYGDITNQGFATEQSVNVGETINFKVHGDCLTIDIFRCGYYGGGVYRRVATIPNTATIQPAATTIPDTNGATTCEGWSVTASWDVPADAVSGMYIAVVRDAVLNNYSNIIFFVREDARTADIVVKVSDSTWGAAYNPFNTMGDAETIESGADLYGVGYLGSIGTRSTQVSFDRPLITRNKVVNHPYNYELALISFLEEQGYNVKYVTCYDLDINRGIGTPKVLINAGHDEYWSQNMRDNVVALQNAGTHILWMSANDIFWRIRYLNSRVIECYKDTMDGPGSHIGGTPLDPTSWTGTWRDTRWASRNPESELHGTLFRMNGIYNYNAVIPTNPYGKHPLWRNTAVVSEDTTLPAHIGFEANTYDPPSQMLVGRAATTLININGAYANDDGQYYTGNGNLDWAIVVSRYEPTQGVNVSFASMNWIWGLSNDQLGQQVENVTTRQATVNLLADVGAAAATLTAGLSKPAPLPLNYYGVGNPALPNVSGNFDYFNDFQDGWASAIAYAAGDVVVNRWRTFEAISGHTSAVSTEPGVGASWQSVWREVNPVLAPPGVPVIVLDKTSLTFSAAADVDPGVQTITVSNSGETPLSFTVSDNAPWLSVTPTSGTDGTVLTVSCVAQSVEDTYTGTITITDPNAANSPKTVAVTYRVETVGSGEVYWVGNPIPPNTGNDGKDYTLGMQFYSFTAPGQVTAIRAYRPAGADSGRTLTGSIWSDDGTLLGSATFGDTSAGGWFEATLSTPVPIAASTYYVVGVGPIRTYVYESNYFDGAPFFTNGGNLYVDLNGGRLVEPPGFPDRAANTAFFVGVRFSTGSVPTSIVLDPASLSFNSPPDVAPNTQTVTVSNPGETPLNFTVSDDAAWLTVSPTSGTDGTVLTVSCAAQSVEATYTGTITITDSNAINSPKTVTVTYTVAPPLQGDVFFDTTPVNVSNEPGTVYTLGTLLIPSGTDGLISGIRAYRPPGVDAGDTISAVLYAGQQAGTTWPELVVKDFPDTSAGGWFVVQFDAPIAVADGALLVAAIRTVSDYAYETGYFYNAVTKGNVLAPASAGRFTDELNARPSSITPFAYFVDYVFQAQSTVRQVMFNDNWIPQLSSSDPTTYTMGTAFNVATRNGNIVGFRTYRPAGADDGVTLTGYLWTNAGVLLGSQQFGDTSAGGWFETLLDTPIPVTAGSAYVVGISPISDYFYQDGVFINDTQFGTNLYANQNAGRFIETAGTFPTQVPVPQGRTYFADVLFEADPL